LSELISVGDYLVLLLEPRQFYPQSSAPQESRIYLIDPRSGQVWLTYRSTSVRPKSDANRAGHVACERFDAAGGDNRVARDRVRS
jgi:hypothetical protein